MVCLLWLIKLCGNILVPPIALWPSNSYNLTMSHYSVAETKNNLSELIDRALRGEGVIITRHGHPVAELKSLAPVPMPVSIADLDWLIQHRVGTSAGAENAGDLLSAMRDEDDR